MLMRAPDSRGTVPDGSGGSEPQQLQVRVDHQPDQLLEVRLRLPAQLALGLRRVAHEQVHLGGALEGVVDAHVRLPVEADVVEGDLDERRTVWVSPVAITKSSGLSCWSISHIAST